MARKTRKFNPDYAPNVARFEYLDEGVWKKVKYGAKTRKTDYNRLIGLGFAIRVLHKSGSWFVPKTANRSALPATMPYFFKA
jgi:hypothetical protein|tara:strand:- start:44 stop:289 length:246 start_codon:yes stop_codon:yes gene_type:complete